MDEPFLCCDECFAHAAQRSTMAAKLWIDLCTYYIHHDGPFNFYAEEMPEIRMLETLGYILSTERKNSLLISVNGLSEDDQGVYFCPRGCDA